MTNNPFNRHGKSLSSKLKNFIGLLCVIGWCVVCVLLIIWGLFWL